MPDERCAYPGCGEHERAGFNGALVVLKGPAIGWWCAAHKDTARADLRQWLATRPAWAPPPPKTAPKAPEGWRMPE